MAVEDKAEQLALSSKYKSEFLANMSHELRTPLNSMLILARLFAENPEQNLTDKQIEFARTIYTAGSDLLDADQRHPRPVEGRGGKDGRPRHRRRARRRARLRRTARSARSPRRRASRFAVEIEADLPADDGDRRAAAPAGAEEPALERVQVHATSGGRVAQHRASRRRTRGSQDRSLREAETVLGLRRHRHRRRASRRTS